MIPCLRVKDGVTFHTIAPGGFRILSALDAATTIVGRDLTITAGTNDHTEGRHPTGEAYDVRTRDLDEGTITALVHFLRARLGSAFTVLYETPQPPLSSALRSLATINQKASAAHIHCQVKRNTVWPPVL